MSVLFGYESVENSFALHPIQYFMETFMLLEVSWSFFEVPLGCPCLTSTIRQWLKIN